MDDELNKLDAGAKDAARMEAMTVSYQVQDLRRRLVK